MAGMTAMDSTHTAPRRTNDSPLARIRIERGLTQVQLADRIGCHQKDVSRWESGARAPGTASLLKLADALGCTMEELIK